MNWEGEIKQADSVAADTELQVQQATDVGWGCSSVVPSDRHTADAGSILRCGKGFFSQSQLSVRDPLTVSVHPRV